MLEGAPGLPWAPYQPYTSRRCPTPGNERPGSSDMHQRSVLPKDGGLLDLELSEDPHLLDLVHGVCYCTSRSAVPAADVAEICCRHNIRPISREGVIVGSCPPGNIFVGPSPTNDTKCVTVRDPVAIHPVLGDVILHRDVWS